ncbi:MAG: hypothetical protein MUC90_06530 [Thermoplasmata archaeon]|jgi:hypothetical protein|nr:hypothetical protein [Thermoplasmata archaeon]
MEERKIALIPRLTVTAVLGPKDYGVLLTDQRIILVMERSSKANVLGAAFGVVGTIAAEAVATERGVDYMNLRPEQLACDENNLCIPYASIRKVRLKRHFVGTCEMTIEHVRPDGKTKKIVGILTVPDQQMDYKRGSGMKFDAINKEYAMKAQEVLRKALPPGVQQHTEWFE